MDKVILYSTHCPRCRAVELMLNKKGIQYETKFIDPNKSEEVQVMLDLGLTGAPGLVVNEKAMDFNQAMTWIRGQ